MLCSYHNQCQQGTRAQIRRATPASNVHLVFIIPPRSAPTNAMKLESHIPESLPIFVLLGGTSPERDISLESGDAVTTALLDLGYSVQQIDPAHLRLQDVDWPSELCLAFNMLHGTFGEDGQAQAVLDALQIPYTGSNAAASRLTFQKHLAKQLFEAANLPTPVWQLISGADIAQHIPEALESLGFPLVVKPDAQGSSIGVSILHSAEHVSAAIEAAHTFDQNVLLETAIIGEEWTVPLIDDRPLPAIRISSRNAFFDYSAKYHDDLTGYEVLTIQESETARRVTDLSVRACRLLKTSGITRVDLIVDRQGQPWLLEVNTIPGMTNHSLVPKSAARLNWTMGDLCKQNILSALAKRTHRKTNPSRDD